MAYEIPADHPNLLAAKAGQEALLHEPASAAAAPVAPMAAKYIPLPANLANPVATATELELARLEAEIAQAQALAAKLKQ
jgi:hypothetical protein